MSEVILEVDDEHIFVIVDGVRVAKRGRPSPPQAMTWISLEPGWEVFSPTADDTVLEIRHNGVLLLQ